MRKVFLSILFVASITVFCTLFCPPASGQGRGAMQGLFQGQAPPPGAVTVLGRAFFDAGEAGFGNALTMLIAVDDQNVRQEIGLTDTEVNSIRLARTQMLLSAPQYANRLRTMTEENQQTLQDDLIRDMGRITQSFNNALPAERRESAQRLAFQTLGGVDSPLISITSMEALNLSADQRTQLEGVFDEMRAERRTHGDKMLEMAEKVIAAGGPQHLSQEDREELQRAGRELEEQSFATARKLAERLRQHLTPEQLELEKQLLASRPAFLPPLPRQLRGGNQENNDTDTPSGDGYTPGTGSWQPGQGVPGQFQIQPGRFPRPQ